MSTPNRGLFSAMTGRGDSPLDIRDLYDRYGHAVFRRCVYFLRAPADAEDAMHDVFVKVVERGADFRGQASPLTWLVRIATNHCLNILRGRKAGWHGRFESTVHVDSAGRDNDQAYLERVELVYALLAKVERDVQLAAVHYFVDEMSQAEAAAAADCSVPTLRKRLRRFIKVARLELKRQDLEVVFGPAPV